MIFMQIIIFFLYFCNQISFITVSFFLFLLHYLSNKFIIHAFLLLQISVIFSKGLIYLVIDRLSFVLFVMHPTYRNHTLRRINYLCNVHHFRPDQNYSRTPTHYLQQLSKLPFWLLADKQL